MESTARSCGFPSMVWNPQTMTEASMLGERSKWEDMAAGPTGYLLLEALPRCEFRDVNRCLDAHSNNKYFHRLFLNRKWGLPHHVALAKCAITSLKDWKRERLHSSHECDLFALRNLALYILCVLLVFRRHRQESTQLVHFYKKKLSIPMFW